MSIDTSGPAVIRAADAMLRTLGGIEISISLPLMAMPDDPGAQLGLVDPGVQEVTFSPVVVRTLPTQSEGPRRRLQFLISSTAVSAALISQNAASAEALFDTALGINYDSNTFHIVDVQTDDFAGTPYLYRVTAVSS